jgi:hypothetical protein
MKANKKENITNLKLFLFNKLAFSFIEKFNYEYKFKNHFKFIINKLLNELHNKGPNKLLYWVILFLNDIFQNN